MPVLPCAIAVVVAGAFLLYRRVDVRLVLLLGAAVLFCLASTQPAMAGKRSGVVASFFIEFAGALVDPRWVVPICTAMGFAYVCKQTGCDAHLVEMLCRPLRHVRWLLIPGGVAVAFFVNSAIVSQTSTISVVGPVLVPLVIAAGFSRRTAGAMLLLGGSMGGELFNPAAVEVNATSATINAVHRTMFAPAPDAAPAATLVDVIRYLTPYNLAACGAALLAFWLIAMTRERRGTGINGDDVEATGAMSEATTGAINAQEATMHSALTSATVMPVERINLAKAIVPLIPIFLLIVVRQRVTLPEPLRPSPSNKIAEQATIAAAMLLGVAAAALVSPRRAGGVAASFFEGAGFAYAHVISVIVAASLFAKGIEMNGLVEWLTRGIGHSPQLITVAGVGVPWIMATVTGTAVGSAPPVIRLLVPVAMSATSSAAGHVVPAGLHLGALCSIAAQFGRTSSPVAPVVLMSAAISRTRPGDLLRVVVPSLLAGGAVLLVMGLLMR